jgi:hypothetical protein
VTRRLPSFSAVARSGRVVRFVWLLAVAVACGGASGPTPFLLEETIPLGAFELEVVDFEPVPSTPPVPLNTLRAQPGDRVVVTFVEWDGLDGLAEPDRFRFVETFLEDRLTLVDGQGNEYRSLSAMTRPMYAGGDTRGMLGGTVPKDWVAVFHVLEDATTFALLVEHPDPREGEPELARVEVGTLDAQ